MNIYIGRVVETLLPSRNVTSINLPIAPYMGVSGRTDMVLALRFLDDMKI
jgi:hypothetical protein